MYLGECVGVDIVYACMLEQVKETKLWLEWPVVDLVELTLYANFFHQKGFGSGHERFHSRFLNGVKRNYVDRISGNHIGEFIATHWLQLWNEPANSDNIHNSEDDGANPSCTWQTWGSTLGWIESLKKGTSLALRWSRGANLGHVPSFVSCFTPRSRWNKTSATMVLSPPKK